MTDFLTRKHTRRNVLKLAGATGLGAIDALWRALAAVVVVLCAAYAPPVFLLVSAVAAAASSAAVLNIVLGAIAPAAERGGGARRPDHRDELPADCRRLSAAHRPGRHPRWRTVAALHTGVQPG